MMMFCQVVLRWGFEVRLMSREGPKVLRCDDEVGPASDLWNGSSEKIRIASLATPTCVLRDEMLNTLSWRNTFRHINRSWSDVTKQFSICTFCPSICIRTNQ